jgi:Mg/Co/Ni transporter MgtE
MTVAATVRNRDRFAAGAMPRGIVAGTVWGLTLGLGLPLLNFANCGVICLSDMAFTTAVSVFAGVAAIGPLAAFRHAPAGVSD